MMLSNLYDLTSPQLIVLLESWGYTAFWAEQVWSALYRDKASQFEAMSALRPDLRERLQAELTLHRPLPRRAVRSRDDLTRKYLLALADGATIETVIMAFRGRYTACVSTQVGCAMGCVFCATGQMGFTRHLTPGEIVGQVLHVQEVLAQTGDVLRNIVFMGMGEPLHNYDHTMAAVDILVDQKGSPSVRAMITVSTVWRGAGYSAAGGG